MNAQINNRKSLRKIGYYITLTSGSEFVKYKHGKGQPRYVWVDTKLENVYWGISKTKEKGSLPLKDIVKICLNPQQSKSECPAFLEAFSQNNSRCLSVEFKDRTLDLIAMTEHLRNDWASALGNVAFAVDKESFVFSSLKDEASDSEKQSDEDMFAVPHSIEDISPECLAEMSFERRTKLILHYGQTFFMYENDQKQERIVWVDGTLEAIHWGIEDEIKKPNGLCDVYKEMGYLPLAEIESVVSAVSTSNVSAAFEKALNCALHTSLVVVGKTRNLELEAPSVEVRDKWLHALHVVVNTDNLDDFIFSDEELSKSSDDLPSEGLLEIDDVYADLDREGSIVKKKEAVTSSIPQNLENLLYQCQDIVKCDRVALFVIEASAMRCAWIEGEECIPDSLADYQHSHIELVIANRSYMIMSDAYEDSRFDQLFDRELKYKSTSVMLIPVLDGSDSVSAVVMFLNKQDFQFKSSYFTVEHVNSLDMNIRDIGMAL